MLREPSWDEDDTGLPDPFSALRVGGLNRYGPEAEILGVSNFAGGVRRATGWRRVVGVGVCSLLLVSLLGSAVVSALELAGDHSKVVQTPSHLP